MFKSKKQFAKAIMRGRKFKFKEYGDLIHYDKTKENPFRCSNAVLQGIWEYYNSPDLTEILPEKPWYNDIPEEGVWCYVWDSESYKRINIQKVTKYVATDDFPFKVQKGCYYKHAESVPELEGK